MVVAGPVAAACSQGPTFDEWAATDGAAGRINLDEVQEAFKKSESASDFERKVNEIYEGDGVILIRASSQGDSDLLLEGFEDLDKSGTIDDANDDVLFSIVRRGENNELQGRGANGYYRSSFGGGNLLFTYLLFSSMGGRGFYNTSPARAGTIRSNRTSYRNSSGYRSQVSKNTSYFNKSKGAAGYTSASRNLSQSRSKYLSTNRTSGAFKTSGTGVRSRWGASSASSRRSSGGFRGGGGTQAVIGFKRRAPL